MTLIRTYLYKHYLVLIVLDCHVNTTHGFEQPMYL